MDSDDDYQQLSAPADPSSPSHQRRLKRLKKAIRDPIAQSIDPIPSTNITDSSININCGFPETLVENPVDLLPNASESEDLNDGRDLENEFDNRNQSKYRPTSDADIKDPIPSSDESHKTLVVEKPVELLRNLPKLEGVNDGRDLDNELDDLFVYRDRSADLPSFDADRPDPIELPSLTDMVTNEKEGDAWDYVLKACCCHQTVAVLSAKLPTAVGLFDLRLWAWQSGRRYSIPICSGLCIDQECPHHHRKRSERAYEAYLATYIVLLLRVKEKNLESNKCRRRKQQQEKEATKNMGLKGHMRFLAHPICGSQFHN